MISLERKCFFLFNFEVVLDLKKDDIIRTSFSRKYSLDQIDTLANQADLVRGRVWSEGQCEEDENLGW